jgi:Nucleotidyl transferase AbiEii toxin, Type IV TA system
MNPIYVETARLLTQIAPLVLVDDTFALKGGTAINLFVRDMPRLSVDLELVFPDYTLPREQALVRINEAIRQAAARLNTRGFHTRAVTATDAGETKLLVRRGGIEVKVEVNFMRRIASTKVLPVGVVASAEMLPAIAPDTIAPPLPRRGYGHQDDTFGADRTDQRSPATLQRCNRRREAQDPR